MMPAYGCRSPADKCQARNGVTLLPVYARTAACAYLAFMAPIPPVSGGTGKRKALVCTKGPTVPLTTIAAYGSGCATMALIAKRSARELLAWLNAATSGTRSLEGGCHCQASWSHRYVLGRARFAATGCDKAPG